MNEYKKCRFCNTTLPADMHGNSYYCNEACYSKHKQSSNYNRYWQQKLAMETFTRVDTLLKMFHQTYGSINYIPAILLDQAGMDWGIMKAEVIIEEMPVKTIGDYGYCLFKNETLRIWKL